MTTLEVGPVWTKVLSPDKYTRDQITDLLKYREKGYRFSPAFKRGAWDGFKNLTNWRQKTATLTFPAGLTEYVLEQPWARDFEVNNQLWLPDAEDADLIYASRQQVELIDLQEQAVQEAIRVQRGIIQAPTGTGKGRIIGEIIRRLQHRALVLCDKRDMLQRSSLFGEVTDATATFGGVVGDGIFTLPKGEGGGVVVATYQTLASKLKSGFVPFLKDIDVLIVDEVQHAEAETYQKVLQACENAVYRIGFSATPFKSWAGKNTDRATWLKVQAFLGPMIYDVGITEAIDAGRIVRPDIYIVHGCDWHSIALNFKEEYQKGIVQNMHRNHVIRGLVRSLNLPTVVLVDRIEHGGVLQALWDVPFVHGGTPSDERQKYYTAFKRGEIQCLIISKIADEALDLPNIEVLILAGGGRAEHRQVQRIGRGMRASEGKDTVMVFDFFDEGQYLSAHSRRRVRGYENQEGYNVCHLTIDEIEDTINSS